MELTRRELLKTSAAAATASAVGITIPASALAKSKEAEAGVQWDKSVCRFCGTGCGIMVGTKEGRIVATKGDPDAPVNKGLNCIKGYFNGKILYGKDRLTTPLLRMTDGEYDKQGDFTAVSWDQAFDIMAEKWKAAMKKHGPTGVGMFGSGQWTVWEGYAASKLYKAIKKRKYHFVLTTQGKATAILNKFFPKWLDGMVYKEMAKEPDSPFK